MVLFDADEAANANRSLGTEGCFKWVWGKKKTNELWGQSLSLSHQESRPERAFHPCRGGTHLEKHLGLPVASFHT